MFSAANILAASLTPGTRRSYIHAWQVIGTFLATHNLQANITPTLPSSTIAYITHAFNKGLAPATITSQMSALSFLNKMLGCPDPLDHFLVKKMLAGARKLRPQGDARLPITPEILATLLKALDMTVNVLYTKTMLKAVFLLAFHAFLRIGEFTTAAANPHCLALKDVVLSANKIQISFSSYKHSKGHLTATTIKPTGGVACPVQAMSSYLNLRGLTPGPLFTFPGGGGISRSFFSQHLVAALRWAQLDPARFTSHSFRIGAATTAGAHGMSDSQIAALGRWHSCAYKKYLRFPTLVSHT